MHIAVARVHVQRHEHTTVQHALMDRLEIRQQWNVRTTREDALQLAAQLAFPRNANRAVLQQVEDTQRRIVRTSAAVAASTVP